MQPFDSDFITPYSIDQENRDKVAIKWNRIHHDCVCDFVG